MSLKEFRTDLLDQLLRFLWRQWSTLGVLGQSGTEDEWAIDPEALLVFSMEIARYEPRLFDSILSWLLENGHRLDVSRLRHIVALDPEPRRRGVMAGAIQWAAKQSKIQKWDNFIRYLKGVDNIGYSGAEQQILSASTPTPTLFLMKSGDYFPEIAPGAEDEIFKSFGVVRSKIKDLKPSMTVPVNSHTNIRFLLRSLFGVGSRAEILLYLLTHEGGHPRDVAVSVGLFWLGVQQTLSDMAESGLVKKKPKVRRVEYYVSHKNWWDFLSFSGDNLSARPKWLNWMAIFSALWTIWMNIDDLSRTDASDYMKSSRLQDSLETLHSEFSRAGLDVPALPTQAIPSDLHQQTTLHFLNKVLK